MARAYPAAPVATVGAGVAPKPGRSRAMNEIPCKGLDEVGPAAAPAMKGQNLRRAPPRRLTEQGSVAVGPQSHFEIVSELLNARGTASENTVE